ncbi:sulfite exporter TauE/SafE family protein [Arenibaculum pallidiluteum]|uniref:sulfite exporter TauE/SafE family protein n=1 Tax=Arenibaculum pallidiluteum TaxID=2812559 RepID=UPI001A9634AF|nr:sulfite exporter TauE/SafE family protein [Arenibaculum pallidiluteum]
MGAIATLLLPQILSAALIGCVAGLVRGLSGFGAGLVMVPLLLLIAPPAEAVPAATLSVLLGSLPQMPRALREADRRMMLRLGAAAVVAQPFGAWLLLAVPAGVLTRVVGVFVIASSLALACARRWQVRATTPRTLGVGAACGLAGGAIGLPGPPVVLYLLACRLPAITARATLMTFFNGLAAMGVALYAAAGLIDGRVLAWTAVLTPAIVLSGWGGEWVFRRTGDRHYRLMAVVLLLLTGAAAFL